MNKAVDWHTSSNQNLLTGVCSTVKDIGLVMMHSVTSICTIVFIHELGLALKSCIR